jgi:hypothetical protein
MTDMKLFKGEKMKNKILFLFLFAVTTGAIFTQDVSYKIGDQGPAGGIIFYDKGIYSDGWRYLEAAPDGVDYYAQWGSNNKNVAGTKTTIGSGKQNTQIVADWLRLAGESGRAAQICIGLDINGFTDWFLPSKDELDLMYKNLKYIGLGSFGNNVYWSSSQAAFFAAWYQRFSDGYQKSDSKKDGYLVRAVRSF